MVQHRFHGDPKRFTAIADFIAEHYGQQVTYVADAAGGQGMLSRLLNKTGYQSEVIDPRGWTLVGVDSRLEKYSVCMADYYDLIVGLHPDQALRDVVESAKIRPIVVVPCCNFWDQSKKLGRDALLTEIEHYFNKQHITFKRITFAFKGPHNIGLVTG